jgi:predicted nuclease of predicted toxin-antitoxin system
VKVLFDQNVPRNLANHLKAHEVTRSVELGWQELKNGDLLEAAQDRGFEVLVTADRNLAYQQNLKGRRLAIVVLPTGNWPLLSGAVADVVTAIGESKAGGFKELKLARSGRGIPLPRSLQLMLDISNM